MRSWILAGGDRCTKVFGIECAPCGRVGGDQATHSLDIKNEVAPHFVECLGRGAVWCGNSGSNWEHEDDALDGFDIP